MGEWKDRQEYVRHFATHAMAGRCARAPWIGRPDILCRQAWEIAECMVAQEQGQDSLQETRKKLERELTESRRKNAELARVSDRQKLLTQAMEERLQPPAEEPAAAASR